MSKLPMTPIRTGGKPARVSEHRLEIDGLAFDVHRSDRRKTMQITVERSGDLSIVGAVNHSGGSTGQLRRREVGLGAYQGGREGQAATACAEKGIR